MKMLNNFLVKDDIKHLREHNCLQGPRVTQMEITNSCHLNCPECYKPPRHEIRFMSLNDCKKNIDDAVLSGAKQMSLLGGEPFEHPNINEIIKYGIFKGLKIMVATNGVYINSNSVNALKKFGEDFTLLLSLNGSTETINNKSRDGYKFIISAAHQLKESNIPFGINWVARHDNASDFEDMIELSENLGAKFINIVANKLTGKFQIQSPLTKEDYNYLIKIIKQESNSHDPNRPFVTVQKCFDMLVAHALKHPRSFLSGCQAGISVAGITLDNQYVPCLHLMHAEKFDSLKDYWNNSLVLRKMRYRDKINSGYCEGCKFVSDCKYCRAMSRESAIDFNSGLRDCQFKEVN